MNTIEREYKMSCLFFSSVEISIAHQSHAITTIIIGDVIKSKLVQFTNKS